MKNASNEIIALEVEQPSTSTQVVSTTTTSSTSRSTKRKLPILESLTEVDMEDEGIITVAKVSYEEPDELYKQRLRKRLCRRVKTEVPNWDNKRGKYKEIGKVGYLKTDRKMSKMDSLRSKKRIKKEWSKFRFS